VGGSIDRASAAGVDSTSRAAAAGEIPPVQTPRPAAAALTASSAIALGPNQVLVKSPMVGTFYRASAPNAVALVDEGGTVRKGQPLCIIEAMKMMNEVEAEVSGSVTKILCANGQPVEYGQPLMILTIA
jgi:acetyl-CoA carboxylase biotin carboxyl carrier protein